MSMTPEAPQRPPHPARHVLGVGGTAALTALILGAFFAAAVYVSSILSGGQMAAVISATLVDLTNEDRLEENLGTLTVNETLVAAAQAKANDMAEKGYFAHVSPEGLNPWYWFNEVGYAYASAGENLAVNFSDSKEVEEAWMNSPGHRANILNAKFTEIGIATARGEYKGRTTTFVVQMFGTPRATTATAPQVTSVPSNPEEPAVSVAEPSENENILGAEEAPAAPALATPTEESPTAPAAEPASTVPETVTAYAGLAERLATSPEELLTAFYIIIGTLVVVALLLVTQMEMKRHHLPHIAAAAFLLVVMAGLWVAAEYVIFTEPIIAEALGQPVQI